MVGESVSNAMGRAAADSAADTVLNHTPESLIRMGYWVTNYTNTLRDDQSIKAFEHLNKTVTSLKIKLPEAD
ncbi:MAG: hypothetical protein K0U12_04775, partial [Gammaproteobacteria bacterium]|nr:hypothetical protein [Gammaproteobacteria bacterium]